MIDEPLAALGAWGRNISRFIFAITNCRCSISRLGAHELGARLDQRRLQRVCVVGKMISALDHARDTSTIALNSSAPWVNELRVHFTAHPAAVGRHVCWGFRQSMPSSM